MSKRLRNLKFLNRQVVALVSADGNYSQKERAEGLQLLCPITDCGKWICDECPVQSESIKPENQRV